MIGQLLAGHYRVLQVLGAGGFGQTYITEDLHLPGHPKCVLKHLKPASTDRSVLDIARKLFEKEAIVLQQLGNHDRIPRLLAYFEEQQEFYLVQEYVPGHPLSTELTSGTKWSDAQVIQMLQEILEILVFIHGQKVIHRDIKPDNIMRRNLDRRLILIDFGAIKQVRERQLLHGQNTVTVAIGTPGYMPIEQASGNPRPSSDLYALGTIGIQALTGINPYDLPTDDGTGELKWEHLTLANPQLIAILQRMTRYHFKDRYQTADEALRAVRGLISGIAPPGTTSVQALAHSLDSQATVVAAQAMTTRPDTLPPTVATKPKRSFVPLIGGISAILAAIASFVWFSRGIFDRQDFATDVRSELCRIATPTDLPTTRVRAVPQRDAKIQVNLARGTKVVYRSEQDAFVQIQMADNSKGWVYNNQISSCNAPAATPKPKPIPTVASPKPIPVPTPKVDLKPVAVPTGTPSPSVTPQPSESPTPIVVPTPTQTATPTPTLTPTASPTPFYPPRSRPTPTPTPTTSPTPESSSAPIDPNNSPENNSTPKPTTSPSNGPPLW
jgi:serine/threonine protein kinase, bacterial